MNPETITPNKVIQELEQQVEEYTFVITTAYGLHARPAAKIANLLRENYAGKVLMSYQRYNPKTYRFEHRNNGEIDPKSVLELLSAALTQGSRIYLKFQNGKPSKELVDAVRDALDAYYPA